MYAAVEAVMLVVGIVSGAVIFMAVLHCFMFAFESKPVKEKMMPFGTSFRSIVSE